MGDHRASIKIEASFHGKKYPLDMWINYYPNDSCGCDERVCKFFKEMWEDGYSRYEAIIYESEKEEREKKEKEHELNELKRLKQKYEGVTK